MFTHFYSVHRIRVIVIFHDPFLRNDEKPTNQTTFPDFSREDLLPLRPFFSPLIYGAVNQTRHIPLRCKRWCWNFSRLGCKRLRKIDTFSSKEIRSPFVVGRDISQIEDCEKEIVHFTVFSISKDVLNSTRSFSRDFKVRFIRHATISYNYPKQFLVQCFQNQKLLARDNTCSFQQKNSNFRISSSLLKN